MKRVWRQQKGKDSTSDNHGVTVDELISLLTDITAGSHVQWLQILFQQRDICPETLILEHIFHYQAHTISCVTAHLIQIDVHIIRNLFWAMSCLL